MCPYETDAPTFSPLSQNFQTDGQTAGQTDKGKCSMNKILQQTDFMVLWTRRVMSKIIIATYKVMQC